MSIIYLYDKHFVVPYKIYGVSLWRVEDKDGGIHYCCYNKQRAEAVANKLNSKDCTDE